MKETCLRCAKAVYPTDKCGPLKDGVFFHQGCFKCYICGTRLALKTYCHNRNDTSDCEVYCNSHVPLAGPTEPVPHRSKLANGHADSLNGGSSSPGTEKLSPRQFSNGAGINDIKIQHALKATAVQKPYPKIIHHGAKYILDYDAQTRLELFHRVEEDHLYEDFCQRRAEEETRFIQQTQVEWEREMARLAAERQETAVARDELIRQLTVRRERQRETMHHRRRERERSLTAELVDRQAGEMLDLFRQARHEYKLNEREMLNGSADSPTSQGAESYPTTPPPPLPPPSRKRDIYTDTSYFELVDQTAISVAQSEQHTFTDLLLALTHDCKSDIDKARAIYRWITVKNLNLMEFDSRLEADTPMGLLRGIKYGTESYHVLFKRLCSYTGLHCVVIKGYSKSAGYQPGMRFDDGRFRNTWNAVFLDGAWRFVQCNWGARHLVNTKDSPPAHRDGTFGSRSENLRYEYDDHYFMTDPEEFIYEFFPSQPEWQLLGHPISLRDFEERPFVRSLFFRYGLSFADPLLGSSVPTDSTGAATVAINLSPDAMASLIFHYNLRSYENEQTDHNGVNLKRYVMQSVVGHTVVFRVHAPCRGHLLLDIFANAVSTGEYLTGQPMKFKSICKFKMVCAQLNVVMVPLPECASGEWGPAKAYRLFGLIPLTHEDAIINAPRSSEIRFRLSRPLADFALTLHRNRTDGRPLQKFAQCSVRGDQLVVKLDLPDDGQYGLDIYTRDREPRHEGAAPPAAAAPAKGLLTHCCKYLINVRP